MKKSFLILNLFFTCVGSLCNKTFAVNYYVDPSSKKNTVNGSLLYPWKSINQLNKQAKIIKAGDVVHFKRGQYFIGQLEIINSGIQEKTITYTNYGVGDLPIFNTISCTGISISNKKFIVIDGIKIIDKSLIPDLKHQITANIKYAITLDNSANCKITNCDISLVATGINVMTGSENTIISGNYIHNLRISINTPKYINSDDDFGANSIVLASSKNTIEYNKFEDCWAISSDYGFDGGAIEFFGNNINDNKIIYNTAINCEGFIEIGSSEKGICKNNIIAYNKIINCGTMGILHNSGPFFIRICNLQFYNNINVETTLQFTKAAVVFWMSGNGEDGTIIVKNNIFWLSSGVNFAPRKFNIGRMVHTNNIFRMQNGDLGISIDKSEIFSRTAELFLKEKGPPSFWNFKLLPQSLARNFGTFVGISSDFEGKQTSNFPNAGIFE